MVELPRRSGLAFEALEAVLVGGKSAGQILSFYYPGTDLGTLKGKVRVLISGDTTSSVIVSERPSETVSVAVNSAGQYARVPASDVSRNAARTSPSPSRASSATSHSRVRAAASRTIEVRHSS